MVTDKKGYEVTGDPFPDFTGTYELAGEHNGKPYYQEAELDHFIWWDGVDDWNLSDCLGEWENYYWIHHLDNIEGEYVHGGDALGTAIVTEI